MSNSSRQAIVQDLQAFVGGCAKLAGLVQKQRAALPSTAQAAESRQLRDQVTQKMAGMGLIPKGEEPVFRESLDAPGGVEFLLSQTLDRLASEKTASASPVSNLGSAAGRSVISSGIPVVNYVPQATGQSVSYQRPYHR